VISGGSVGLASVAVGGGAIAVEVASGRIKGGASVVGATLQAGKITIITKNARQNLRYFDDVFMETFPFSRSDY